MSENVIEFSDQSFGADVLEADTPVLVDFWAIWCGPCKAIAPIIDEIANDYSNKVKVGKVDVDNNPNSPAAMGVRGIPALFIFKDGQVISNRAGAAPKAALQSWIQDSI